MWWCVVSSWWLGYWEEDGLWLPLHLSIRRSPFLASWIRFSHVLPLVSSFPRWLPLVKQYNEREACRRQMKMQLILGVSRVWFLSSSRFWFCLVPGVGFGCHREQVVQMKSQWLLSWTGGSDKVCALHEEVCYGSCSLVQSRLVFDY